MPGRLDAALFDLAASGLPGAMIAEVVGELPLSLVIDGVTVADVRYLDGYTPTRADAVLVLFIESEPVVIGALA